MNLELVTNPTMEKIADFHHGLRDYNSEFVSEEFIPLRAVITDDADQVIAGIDGMAHWDKLHVSILWVHADHKGNALGTQLIEWAEEQGRTMGYHSVVVDTMSFQAPGFYLKLGYTQFGETRNYEGSHGRLYFEKGI